MTQSLLIGANTWLVERASDILYLQVLSQALIRRKREGINSKWTLCPSVGIDKIAPFVRLFGGNRMNVAVLSDIANGDRTKIENLKKANILKAGHFYTCADFAGQVEADVEDLFDVILFAEMLNGAYQPPAEKIVTAAALEAPGPTPRVVKNAEMLFNLMPVSVAESFRVAFPAACGVGRLETGCLGKRSSYPAACSEDYPHLESLLVNCADRC